MSYYFLSSSLPMLSMDSKPAVSRELFMQTCAQHMLEADYAALEFIMSENRLNRNVTPHPFVKAWQDHETELRNAIVRERASKSGRQADPLLRDYDGARVSIQTGVADALGRQDPREAEQLIDRLRWSFIEELQGQDQFSAARLLGYGLKLLIAERWAGMDKDNGRARVEGLVDKMTAQV